MNINKTPTYDNSNVNEYTLHSSIV